MALLGPYFTKDDLSLVKSGGGGSSEEAVAFLICNLSVYCGVWDIVNLQIVAEWLGEVE